MLRKSTASRWRPRRSWAWHSHQTPAGAEHLYWGHFAVATRPLCFQQLEQAAYAVGLNNVRVQPDTQVSGGLNDNHTYAVLTCTPSGDHVLAMVMVAGDNASNAQSARASLQNYMASANQPGGK